MLITNKAGLPEPIVRAVSNDEYSKGAADISITGLIRPPRISALFETHAHEITIDVTDLIWSLVGRVGHGILERAAEAGSVVEERLYARCGGWTVSGQPDHLSLASDGTLTDWKFVTVWKGKDPDKREWEQQLNGYLWLLRQNGHPLPGTAQILAIYRDWSKREAARDPTYPQLQAQLFPVPIWPADRQDAFIASRVALHQEAASGSLPVCTDADVWRKPAKFALLKKGRKTAVKLFDSHPDLLNWADQQKLLSPEGKLPAEYMVSHRPSLATRCLYYCPVSRFCRQWADDETNPAHERNSL